MASYTPKQFHTAVMQQLWFLIDGDPKADSEKGIKLKIVAEFIAEVEAGAAYIETDEEL